MLVEEAAIPVPPQVEAACEFLGLDPLYMANEGKLVAIVPPAHADRLLAVMRSHPLGRQAALIGEVQADPQHFVQMRTRLGGRRIVDWLAGDRLPRMCRHSAIGGQPSATATCRFVRARRVLLEPATAST